MQLLKVKRDTGDVAGRRRSQDKGERKEKRRDSDSKVGYALYTASSFNELQSTDVSVVVTGVQLNRKTRRKAGSRL